ncbi:hypothetical protein EJ08DRAFT_736187 [Tothia fuscella]|uniref:Uncharacterized protein n=1 Tax=Tothia fuscella TaxID=1048955 RepID=A0A9P4TV59_9PEZI|nr:hypothetical protein EJ08DRAFT_736187 [Tothia fuscella]
MVNRTSITESIPAPSFNSTAPSTLPPPAYSRHQNDELLSPSASYRVRRRFSIPRPSPRRADPSQMLQVLAAPGPLNLTIDNGLIYPPPPSNALYHLPRVLTWSGNEIFLFRSLPTFGRSHAHPTRDLALYTMRRTPFTHEIALLPRREGLKAATMRGRRSLLSGMTWEVDCRDQTLLRYAKGKWKDGAGNILAEEQHSGGQREGITITGQDLEVNMKDLIVAAWTARVWQGRGKVSLAKTLMREIARCHSTILEAIHQRWRTEADYSNLEHAFWITTCTTF